MITCISQNAFKAVKSLRIIVSSSIRHNFDTCCTVSLLENQKQLFNNDSTPLPQKYILARNFSVSLVLERVKHKADKKSIAKSVKVDLNEVANFVNIDNFTKHMDQAIDDLKKNFTVYVSLRSSTGSIEQIVVNFEGDDFMLQELVQVARKPKMVVLNVNTFPQAIPQILEAISKSGLNLNPQQEGTTLYIPVPKVTKEHREGLAKNAKALYIKCRDKLKDVKNKEVKKLKNTPSISEDQIRRVENQLVAMCEKYVKDAESLLDAKQKELLKSLD